MNINNKFSRNHLLIIAAFISVIIFFTFCVSIKEGQTSKLDSGCDPSVNIKENSNDLQIGSLITDHVSNSMSIIDSYLPQLKEIQEKFKNVSSCLTIGTIDTSSENSIPVITIDDPEPGTINQKINYILPRGQKGDQGQPGVYAGAFGPWGKKGTNGDRGPVGENIVPKNIHSKVY